MCLRNHLFHHPLAYLLGSVLEPRLLQGMRLAGIPLFDGLKNRADDEDLLLMLIQ